MTAGTRLRIKSSIDQLARQRQPHRREQQVVGGNDDWLILECAKCPSLFDVPNRRTRLPELCPDCRETSRHHPDRHRKPAGRVA
jgi:hypothetical protein